MTRYHIHQGDALDLIPTLGRFDLIVTDPPYVIGAVSAGNLASKAGTWGDMMNSSRWFSTWYEQCRAALRPDGAMWTFCNWRSLPVVMKAGADIGWGMTSCLVWQKGMLGTSGPTGLRPTYELVCLFHREDFAIPDRGTPDCWLEQGLGAKPSGHPAEKPVALLRRLIAASGKEGGRILDPFAGSGSTLRAGLDLGCEVVGIETEERYCRIIEERCAQLNLGDAA